VEPGYFSKTVEFEDVNYSAASSEEQSRIFDAYTSVLNYFDCSYPLQISLINRRIALPREAKAPVTRQDGLIDIGAEYDLVVSNHLTQFNKGIKRCRYISFGVKCQGIKEARLRLHRVQEDLIANLEKLGAKAKGLCGSERLEVLYTQLNPQTQDRFRFSWDELAASGLGSKDFVAPTSFLFKNRNTFRLGDTFGAASHIQVMASELSDKFLDELGQIEAEMSVTLHIKTIDQLKAIKMLKRKISDIGKMKMDEQKKAARSGYDIDILPPDLITYSKEASELLTELQHKNERLFLLTLILVNTASSKQKLENDLITLSGVCQKHNCALKRLDFQQEQGLSSSLILGHNTLEIERGMTSSSTAILLPFNTAELHMEGQALYYGINALSKNVIMANRKKLNNPNGIFLGEPGSGKSFKAKCEIISVLLGTSDRIFIVDNMGEYLPLIRKLGEDIAEVIEISPNSRHHINPLDITMGVDSCDENPFARKADFILSLMELIVGNKDGLSPVEKSIIDRTTRLVYRDVILNPQAAKMPILQDFYNVLKEQSEPEAAILATALELYCLGSLSVFNHQTNVNVSKRVTCVVLSKLGVGLRKIAMHITNELSTAAVERNFRAGLFTWCYYDEFHILLRDALTASYFVSVWKMLRKKACVPTALTQNVKDLLASREIENILETSDFLILLSQAHGDREILAKKFSISQEQLSYIKNKPPGEGLLLYGGMIIPIMDRFPKESEIYKLITTRPEDLHLESVQR